MSPPKFFPKTGPSKEKNFICSDSPGQNIWNKIEKSSESRQDKKRLISAFACLFTAIAKV